MSKKLTIDEGLQLALAGEDIILLLLLSNTV